MSTARHSLRVLAIGLLAAGAAAAAGCASPAPPLDVSDAGLVWLDEGMPRTIDLTPFVGGGEGSVSIAGDAHVAASAAGLAITLTPAPNFLGETALPFTVSRGRRHGSGTLSVRVKEAVRSCRTTLTWNGPAVHVYAAGDWNGFSATASPLSGPDPDGVFSTTLDLAPGDYAYKFVVDGTYVLDPAQPFTMWEGGVENSRLAVPDCGQPRLDPFDVAVVSSSGTFGVNVAFVAGSSGAPAAAPPSVTLDGMPWNASWDDATRVLAMHDGGLAAGKHQLVVQATDTTGRAADDLVVPFWIDAGKTFDWHDAVTYFAFTDRFRNGDPGNDAPEAGVQTPANYQGGDWKGVQDAIDEGYFDDLGVNVLWLSPQVDNPPGGFPGTDGRQYAGYHGYWPAQPRAAEEHFGGMSALKAAVDAAHAHGIRVLLDAVLNHVHQDHPYWQQHMGPPWFHDQYVCGYDQPINCWFAAYLPDLDYQDLDVVKTMESDMEWWVRETNADGFRVDAVKHFEHVVERTLRGRLAADYDRGGSHFYMVGETFVGRWADGGQATVAPYVNARELDGQFDFPLYWEIVRTIGRHEGSLGDLDAVLEQEQSYYGPQAIMGTFLGNHDVPRFLSHANGDIADLYGTGAQEQGWTSPPGQPMAAAPYQRLRQGFTLLFAMPGMPTIYYGDELGLAGAGDPDNRRFMPWTGWNAEQQATRDLVKLLAATRHAHAELERGTVKQVWLEPDLLVLERTWLGRRAYVAINRGTADRVVNTVVHADDGTSFRDVVGGDAESVSGGHLTFRIPANGSALYVQP